MPPSPSSGITPPTHWRLVSSKAAILVCWSHASLSSSYQMAPRRLSITQVRRLRSVSDSSEFWNLPPFLPSLLETPLNTGDSAREGHFTKSSNTRTPSRARFSLIKYSRPVRLMITISPTWRTKKSSYYSFILFTANKYIVPKIKALSKLTGLFGVWRILVSGSHF